MKPVNHKQAAEDLAGILIEHVMQDQESIGLVDITDEDALLILKEVVAITERRLKQALTF